MTYGAHKLMVEIALENLTRLRRLDELVAQALEDAGCARGTPD